MNPLARRKWIAAWWGRRWNGKRSPALATLLVGKPDVFLDKLRTICGEHAASAPQFLKGTRVCTFEIPNAMVRPI